MKNYTVVSRMCDEIFCFISSLKNDATDPTKPDYVRIQAQRRIASFRDFLSHYITYPYFHLDEDFPF